MAIDLNTLSSATTTATALSNLILVNPQQNVGFQPLPKPGVDQQEPAFLFNYEGENTTLLESDITDHFAEDNKAIQDQIALKSVIITTHGFIGELNDIVPDFFSPLTFIKDKLTVLSAYTPGLSTTAINVYNQANRVYQTASLAASSAVSAWNLITGQGGKTQTKQQVAFGKFYGWWQNRTLFKVQTPWAVFDNMAIRTLRAVQDPDTRMITDFEISFKQMRFANTKLITVIAGQGRFNTLSAPLIDNGASTPNSGDSFADNYEQAYA